MAFLSDITIGQFVPGESLLHRLDPRSKFIAGLLFMTTLLVAKSLPVVMGFSIVAVLGCLFSGVPSRSILGNLKPFIWLFLITFVIHLLTTPGDNLIAVVPVLGWEISETGLSRGILYTYRLVLLLVLAALLTLTTQPVELADSLERVLAPLKRFRVPVHDFVLMMTLTLRFLPVLLREAERTKNAQIARGASFEGRFRDRIRNLIAMILPLMLATFRRVDELAAAMEARNYSGSDSRTSYTALSLRMRDALMLAGAVCFNTWVLFVEIA